MANLSDHPGTTTMGTPLVAGVAPGNKYVHWLKVYTYLVTIWRPTHIHANARSHAYAHAQNHATSVRKRRGGAHAVADLLVVENDEASHKGICLDRDESVGAVDVARFSLQCRNTAVAMHMHM